MIRLRGDQKQFHGEGHVGNKPRRTDTISTGREVEEKHHESKP